MKKQDRRIEMYDCLSFYLEKPRQYTHEAYIYLSLGPRSFVLGRKDPGYLWNEAINHIAVSSPNNVTLRGIRYNIQRCY